MVLIVFLALLQCVTGQYMPVKHGPVDSLYSQGPMWYGFFPPVSARKSPWSQQKRISANLKRNLKQPVKPNLKLRAYKRWGPPKPVGHIINPHIYAQQVPNQKRYGIKPLPHNQWQQQKAYKRMGPNSQYPTKPIIDNKHIQPEVEKRWGPKYMIVENSKVTHLPGVSENTKVLQYNELPEKLTHFTDEPVGFDDSESMSNMNLKESIDNLQEQSRYLPTNEIYKSFTKIQNNIAKENKIHELEDLYTRKELNKPTSTITLHPHKTIRLVEDAKPKASPNPEMEEFAAKFIDSPAYKNFNVLRYINFKKQHEQLPAVEHGKFNDIKGELVLSSADQQQSKTKLLEHSSVAKLVPTNLVEQRKELIHRYLKQKGVDKQILNEKIKSIRLKAIEEYKRKQQHSNSESQHSNLESQHSNSEQKDSNSESQQHSNSESISDRMDEPQYESSQQQTHTLSHSQTADPTRHIDVEERSKHGTQMATDQLIRHRPSLQIGKDLHGENETSTTRDLNEPTQGTILHFVNKPSRMISTRMDLENRKQPKSKKETEIIPDITVKGGITSDADKPTETEQLSPMPTSDETAEDTQTTEEAARLQPTNPIIPFKKPAEPIISKPKQIVQTFSKPAQIASMLSKPGCISCEKLPSNTKLIPVYMCCKPVTISATKDSNGKIIPAGTTVPIQRFANQQKPIVSDVSGIQRPNEQYITPSTKPISSDVNSLSRATEQQVAEAQIEAQKLPPKPALPTGDKQILDADGTTISIKPGPTNLPAETSSPIAPSVKPILPSGTTEDQPLQSGTDVTSLSDPNNPKPVTPAASLIENQNPVIPAKRPPADSCSGDACEAGLMKDMKSKMMSLYDMLFDRGGNHHIEIYSTGCKGQECSKAVGIIKFDGMILGGRAPGMNIVVLGYPGFELLYSKTYRTGIDKNEGKKMMQFLTNVKAPSIIMMAGQGDVTTAMTDDAWNMLADLGCRTSFIKSSGASFAFLGYKGADILPWTQVNQRLAGDGTSAIFSILGSDTEYITFGGSGQTLTNLAKLIIKNDGNTGETREHSKDTTTMTTDAKENNSNKVPLEAEGDFEPLSPITMKHSSQNNKEEAEDISMKLTNQDLPQEVSVGHHKVGKIPVIIEHDNQHSSADDRSFEAGLSDADASNTTVSQKMCDGKPCLRQLPPPPIEPIAPVSPTKKPDEDKKPKNKTEEKKPKEPEKPEKPEKSNDTEPHRPDIHPIEPFHPMELPHHPEVPISEAHVNPHHGDEHHQEHVPFVGQIVNTGHETYRPHDPTQVYQTHPHGNNGHSGSQMYSPVHDGYHGDYEEHHNGLIPNIHSSPNAHIGYGQPFEHPFEIHPVGENDQHGAMVSVTPSMAMHGGYGPTNTHHIDGYNGNYGHHEPFINGHNIFDQHVGFDQHNGYPASFHPVFGESSMHHNEGFAGMHGDWNHHEDGPWNHDSFHEEPHHEYHEDHHEEHHDDHHDDHHDEHRIPILNIPHPYIITSSTPIHPSHEEAGNGTVGQPGLPVVHHAEHIEPPYMHKAVESEPIYAPPHHDESHDEPHHDEEHHEEPHTEEPHQVEPEAPEKPKNETIKDEKNEKKTPAPMSPEFQTKFREMLAEELSKKLKELNIVPNAALNKAKLLSKEALTASFIDNGNHETGESREHKPAETDDSHDNIDVSKVEHFVHGDADDFDNDENENSTENSSSSTSELNKPKKTHNAEEDGAVRFSGPNYDYSESEEDNESLKSPKSKEQSKQNVKSTDNKEKAKETFAKEGSENKEKEKFDKEPKTGETDLKPTDTNAKIDSKKQTNKSNEEKSKASSKLTDSKNTKNNNEPSETVHYKNTRNLTKAQSQIKPQLTLTHIENKLTQHIASSSNATKYNPKAVSSTPGIPKEKPDTQQLFDTQEEFPDDSHSGTPSPVPLDTQKTFISTSNDNQATPSFSTSESSQDSIDPLAENSKSEEKHMDEIDKELQEHESLMNKGLNSPIAEIKAERKDIKSKSEKETTDKGNGKICKRFKILKNGKKIELKLKKNCIEKLPDEKVKHRAHSQALPDASETVTALSLNPGYSTLPGAETHTAQNEVSYYFGNKYKESLPTLKDSIYGDVTSSNIYECSNDKILGLAINSRFLSDQGDYMNTAEKLLQRDVSDAYNTANDIMTAEEAVDKTKTTTRRNKTIYKRDKKGKSIHKNANKGMKREKLSRARHKKWLDEELLKDSFTW